MTRNLLGTLKLKLKSLEPTRKEPPAVFQRTACENRTPKAQFGASTASLKRLFCVLMVFS